MTFRGRSALLAGVIIVLAAGSAEAQSARSTTSRTIWEGVYTEAQASRGQQLVQRNCASCHSAAEWSQTSFLSNWTGQPVRELHSFISGAMPLDAPGKLTVQEYTDIVAYMLKLNSVPAGSRELPVQLDSLRRIQVTARQR